MVNGQKKKEIRIFFVGLTFMVLGVVMTQFWESLIRAILNNELSLHPNSIAFKEWRYQKKPVSFKMYFWNWTNPDGISQENYKPSFVEMGPYAFKLSREKVNITFNENGTITYRTKPYWHFDQENSNGSLSDNITSVNVIAATASYMTKAWSRALLYPLSMFLISNGQKISWSKNVSQILFDGSDNPLLKMGTYIPGYRGPEKFAWFYKRNGTPIEYYLNIDTGQNNINNIGQLYFINYQNKSDYHQGCPDIKGSAGEFYSPDLKKEEPIKLYSPYICRQMYHYFTGESMYKSLKTYLYSGTKETVDNGTLVKEVKCYCKNDDCPPSGVFDIGQCQNGAPLFVSHPHFITADPYYRDSIEGMNPNPSKHTSYMAIEPLTGIQMNVSLKFQMNVFITRNPGISIFRKVSDLYIPVFWLETQNLQTGFYLYAITAVVIFMKSGPYLWYTITVLGFFTVLVLAVYRLQSHFSRRRRNLVKNQNNEKEALRNAREQNGLETVKYIIPENKAETLD